MNPFSIFSRSPKLDLRVRKMPGNQLLLKTGMDAVAMDTAGLVKLSVAPVDGKGTYMLTGSYRQGTGIENRDLIELPDQRTAMKAHEVVYDAFSASWKTVAMKGVKIVAGIVVALFVLEVLFPSSAQSNVPAPVSQAPATVAPLASAAQPEPQGEGASAVLARLHQEAAHASQTSEQAPGTGPVAGPAAAPVVAGAAPVPVPAEIRVPKASDIYSFDRQAIRDSIPAPTLNCDTK
jgi:hypothetical protein